MMQFHLSLDANFIGKKTEWSFFLFGDKTMDGDANQEQLLSNSSINMNDATNTEEIPLTDYQPDGDQEMQTAIPTTVDWDTSMISQVRI